MTYQVDCRVIQRRVTALSMCQGRVAHLLVTTLIGASKRRKEEVTDKVDGQVNPEACSRAQYA